MTILKQFKVIGAASIAGSLSVIAAAGLAIAGLISAPSSAEASPTPQCVSAPLNSTQEALAATPVIRATIPTPIATDTRLSSQPLPKMTACRTLFPAFATPLITLGAIATTPRQQKPSGSATATKDDY